MDDFLPEQQQAEGALIVLFLVFCVMSKYHTHHFGGSCTPECGEGLKGREAWIAGMRRCGCRDCVWALESELV